MRRRHPLISGGRGHQHGSSPSPAPPPSAASAATAPLIRAICACVSADKCGRSCGAAAGSRLILAAGISGGDATRRRGRASARRSRARAPSRQSPRYLAAGATPAAADRQEGKPKIAKTAVSMPIIRETSGPIDSAAPARDAQRSRRRLQRARTSSVSVCVSTFRFWD
jgi:hypothetical protein